MIGEDGKITEEERHLLKEYKNSDFMRIARKAIGQQWRFTASSLMRCDKDSLQFHQGVMAGLNNAYNTLLAVMDVQVEEGLKERPVTSKIL